MNLKYTLGKIKEKIKRATEPPVEMTERLIQNGATIGENFHDYSGSYDIMYSKLLTIGDNVTITNAKILLHDANPLLFMGDNSKIVRKVTIGNNVFIGWGAMILCGTTIGNNVIVGAGSVVRGNVPDNSVIIGNPWRVVSTYDDYVKRCMEKKKNGKIYTVYDEDAILKDLDDGYDVFIP